jgi:hypothetical protein
MSASHQPWCGVTHPHTQVRAEKDALAKKLKAMESKILKVI